jgi:hypothetical protein
MIERALGGVFRVVTDEAASNPAFAKKLEDALAGFADDYAARRKAEADIGDFHPFIAYRKSTPEEFAARLSRFDAKALRLIVAQHNLDPANELKGKGAKKALVEHIFAAARKRAERDAKLFEY